jgi:hypothetical protein
MLNDWVNRTIWQFSGAPICPEDNTWMELHGVEALQVAVRSLTQGIRSYDDKAQKSTSEQIIRISNPWTIRRWSESNLAKEEQLVEMPKMKEHIVNLTWTTAEQQTLHQLVIQYKSQGEGGAYWVHWWRLACFSLILGVMEDKNVSSQRIQSWSEIDNWCELTLFQWLGEVLIPMLVREPAEYLPAELEMDPQKPKKLFGPTLLLRKWSNYFLSLAKSEVFNGGSSSI